MKKQDLNSNVTFYRVYCNYSSRLDVNFFSKLFDSFGTIPKYLERFIVDTRMNNQPTPVLTDLTTCR